MELFDIHTHRKPLHLTANGYDIRYILNVYPRDFYVISENSDSLFSCGVHPWYLNDSNLQLSLLSEISKDRRVVAIGEAGLDKLQETSLDIQIDIFRKQIDLAIKLQKPLIIHCVKAWDELIELYKEYKSNIPWIIHGYRGKPEQARQLCNMGFKLSIGANSNQETLKNIPLEALFCETDTSATSIYDVYRQIADVLNIAIDKLSVKIADNIKCTFGECIFY